MQEPHESQIDELLQRWQQRHQSGETLSVEELCRECPDLTEDVRRRIERESASGGETLGALTTPEAGSVESRATSWPRLDGYIIEGVLGKGGMGIVYKARQLSLNRLVAVKLLLDAANPLRTGVDRFRREAELLAGMQHPNIVQIHDVQEQAGQPFIAMEYLAAGSLSARLKRSPMTPREAAALVEVLSRAIGAAHQQGILHRDLKPSNVLLAVDGTPKIADFGLAKRLEGDPQETPSGMIIGTPCYMAPEQAAGKKDVGKGADIYSLGAILYECLTGQPPFRAETPVATIGEVLVMPPPPIRKLRSDVPRALESICLKCLEKSPDNRYASANDLAADLERWLSSKPLRGIPGLAGRVVRSLRRPRVLGLAIMFLFLVGVLGWLWLRPTPEKELQKINDELERAQSVTLIPEGGPPRWWSWVPGFEPSSQPNAPGPFTFGSFSTALLELVPRMPVRRYVVTLEVRQDEPLDGSYVGLYFALLVKNGPNGPEYFYYQLVFTDNDIENSPLGPRLEFRRMAANGPKGRVDMSLPLASAGQWPTVQAPARSWRKLKVEVSPDGLKTWEGDNPLEEFNFKDLTRQLELFRKVQRIDPEQPLLPVEGRLGLCVCRCDASFRSVIVTPIGEK
jgi:serine/threonine protein kinase